MGVSSWRADGVDIFVAVSQCTPYSPSSSYRGSSSVIVDAPDVLVVVSQFTPRLLPQAEDSALKVESAQSSIVHLEASLIHRLGSPSREVESVMSIGRCSLVPTTEVDNEGNVETMGLYIEGRDMFASSNPEDDAIIGWSKVTMPNAAFATCPSLLIAVTRDPKPWNIELPPSPDFGLLIVLANLAFRGTLAFLGDFGTGTDMLRSGSFFFLGARCDFCFTDGSTEVHLHPCVWGTNIYMTSGIGSVPVGVLGTSITISETEVH